MFISHNQVLSKSDWNPSNSLYYDGISTFIFKLNKDDIATYKKNSTFFRDHEIGTLLKKANGGFDLEVEVEFQLSFPDTVTQVNGWIALQAIAIGELSPGKGWKERAVYKKVVSESIELSAKLDIKDGYKENVKGSEDLENHTFIKKEFEKFTEANSEQNVDAFLEHLKYLCFTSLDTDLR